MIFKNKLHWQILIALVAAVPTGYFFPDWIPYITWMGVVFLRALNMVVVPLILSSIVSGVSTIGGGSNLGRLGFKNHFFLYRDKPNRHTYRVVFCQSPSTRHRR
jgi:Na+/H+-dicarboxylate symporter